MRAKTCYVRDIALFAQEMMATGAALVPSAIEASFLRALTHEIRAEPFEPVHETVGHVRQDFGRFAFFGRVQNMPMLEALRIETEAAIRRVNSGWAGWRARDIIVQKYADDGGVTAHRDLKRHPAVIVICNILGSAEFELLTARNGEVIARFKPKPGDLILLRGAGNADDPIDRRPFHRVGKALHGMPRISATFRDNDNPGKPIANFRYRNFKGGSQ